MGEVPLQGFRGQGGLPPQHALEALALLQFERTRPFLQRYKGTSLIRKRPPPGTTIGPQAQADCRVLEEGVFL